MSNRSIHTTTPIRKTVNAWICPSYGSIFHPDTSLEYLISTIHSLGVYIVMRTPCGTSSILILESQSTSLWELSVVPHLHPSFSVQSMPIYLWLVNSWLVSFEGKCECQTVNLIICIVGFQHKSPIDFGHVQTRNRHM